ARLLLELEVAAEIIADAELPDVHIGIRERGGQFFVGPGVAVLPVPLLTDTTVDLAITRRRARPAANETRIAPRQEVFSFQSSRVAHLEKGARHLDHHVLIGVVGMRMSVLVRTFSR